MKEDLMNRLIFLLVLIMIVKNIVLAAENAYFDEVYKVSLKGPERWYVTRMDKKITSDTKLVKFSEYPASAQFANKPQILLAVKEKPKWARNLDEWLKHYLQEVSKLGFRPLDPPKEVLINGNQAVRIESELFVAGMASGRTVEYLFWGKDLIYMLTLNIGEEDMDEVDRYIEIFNNCVNTLLIEK